MSGFWFVVFELAKFAVFVAGVGWAYRTGKNDGRDAQWVEDSMALQRELAARRDRSGKFKPARGPLVLPPRSKE